jgi:hypothetical protein
VIADRWDDWHAGYSVRAASIEMKRTMYRSKVTVVWIKG